MQFILILPAESPDGPDSIQPVVVSEEATLEKLVENRAARDWLWMASDADVAFVADVYGTTSSAVVDAVRKAIRNDGEPSHAESADAAMIESVMTKTGDPSTFVALTEPPTDEQTNAAEHRKRNNLIHQWLIAAGNVDSTMTVADMAAFFTPPVDSTPFVTLPAFTQEAIRSGAFLQALFEVVDYSRGRTNYPFLVKDLRQFLSGEMPAEWTVELLDLVSNPTNMNFAEMWLNSGEPFNIFLTPSVASDDFLATIILVAGAREAMAKMLHNLFESIFEAV